MCNTCERIRVRPRNKHDFRCELVSQVGPRERGTTLQRVGSVDEVGTKVEFEDVLS